MHVYKRIYLCIYAYVCTHVIYIYIYIYISSDSPHPEENLRTFCGDIRIEHVYGFFVFLKMPVKARAWRLARSFVRLARSTLVVAGLDVNGMEPRPHAIFFNFW